MSNFPTPDNFSQKITKQHLSNITHPTSTHVFKKQKEVYLYDLDGNKFLDFSLQQGEIFGIHSPPRLSQFLKNALSSGFGHSFGYNKFLYKAQQVWKKLLNTEEITFFTSPIQAILTIMDTISDKSIGVDSPYLEKIVSPLKSIIPIINIIKNPQAVGLLLCEQNTEFIFPHQKKILVESRFFLRNPQNSSHIERIIMNIEGYESAISTSAYKQTPISPQDGIFFLEGAKYLTKLKEHKPFQFTHSHVESFNYFSFPQKSLDKEFFLKRGIVVESDILYFSPNHSIHDLKRLSKALDEYFHK